MRTFSKIIITTNLVLAVLMSACSYKIDKGGEATSLSPGQALNFSFIRSTVIAPNCFQCHLGSGGEGGLDLSTYSALVSNQLFIVGDPEHSDLFTQINTGQMPFGSAKLSNNQIQAVRDWIQQGAPEN